MKYISGRPSSGQSGAAALTQSGPELQEGARKDYADNSGRGQRGETLIVAQEHAQDHINSEHGTNR